jgi:hypothetical protein
MDRLIWRLTLDFMTGVRPEFMLVSDETGRHLAAMQVYVYAETGAREVLAELFDDKRAITV